MSANVHWERSTITCARVPALQNGKAGPDETSDAWAASLKMKLVWRDPFDDAIRITPAGERYPA